MIRLLLSLLAALWLLSPLAPARTFLDLSRTDWGAGLPPPPAADSPAGLADLSTVLQVQADRTAEQVARARRVEQHTPFLMGTAVMGPWFTAENLPRTAEIMQAVWKETNRVATGLKKKWMRERPSAFDVRVQPCVKVPGNSSYPSGHSTNATVWAAILSAAFPEHAAAFAAQARETMWARVLGGAHFPSDTEAGRLFGEEIARAMLASAEMPAAIEEMRAEVAAWQARSSSGAKP